MTRKEKRDIYAEVTEKIKAALREGVVLWRKPWIGGLNRHRNANSNRPYRGINPWLLELTAMQHGYTDHRWLTFKGAQKLGGNVRKGEHGTLVLFWKRIKIQEKDEKTGETKAKIIPLARAFTVFNVEQCENLTLREEEHREPVDPIAAAEEIVEGYDNAPDIRTADAAYYVPPLDTVGIPSRDRFLSSEGYYAALFHELTHSTGHESRLNRDDLRDGHFGDEPYAREELVAEFGASMLCGVAGIAPAVLDNSASYIANWLQALDDDPKLVVTAAARAQKAADWILGTTFDEEPEEQHKAEVAVPVAA